MTLLANVILAVGALAWQPAADWRETPDPDASPRARVGGTVRFSGGQSPKSLNGYVDNNVYTRMTFDLMYGSLLGTDSATLEFVPALARRWAVTDEGRTFVFELDPRARWSDGRPVTSGDVKWTFDAVMAPASDTGSWKAILSDFESPEVVDSRTVRFRRHPGGVRDWRDLLHCSGFPVLPSHAFRSRDFNKLDFLGAPVSGPYRLARVDEQVETEFAREANWWRLGSPSVRGTYNFDRILIRYHADSENAFEALKKRQIDVYPVYTARLFANGTRGEKFARNWILKRSVRNLNPIGFQGFAMNARRKPFDDVRVRRAMAMLIDRETMNRTMMQNAYFLLKSYSTDLYDAAHPCANELVPYSVEGAKKLLAEAGYAKGFHFTFLSRSSTEEKFLSLFNHALERCGVKMDIVRKDFAGWMRDMDEFSFDMTWQAWGAGVFKDPGTMWRSSEADRKGSNNTVGFRSAEVDRLVEAEKSMATMAERMEAYRRIDALVAAACPYALLWHTDRTRLLYWNKFGMPDGVLGRRSDESGILTYWWYDDDRARELDEAMRAGTCLPTVPCDVVHPAVGGGEEKGRR